MLDALCLLLDCPSEAFYLSCVVDTRYTVEDIEGALLKQMKASKDTSIAVKKPEDQNIRFTNYGNSLWTWQACTGIDAIQCSVIHEVI